MITARRIPHIFNLVANASLGLWGPRDLVLHWLEPRGVRSPVCAQSARGLIGGKLPHGVESFGHGDTR